MRVSGHTQPGQVRAENPARPGAEQSSTTRGRNGAAHVAAARRRHRALGMPAAQLPAAICYPCLRRLWPRMERAHACGAKRPNPKSNAARAAQRHWAEGGTGVRSLARARGRRRERGRGQRDRRCAQRTTWWRAGVPPRAVWRPAAPHRRCWRGVKNAGSRLHLFACLLTSETAPPSAEKPAAAFRCGGLEGCGRAAAAHWRAAPSDVPARRSPRVCPRAFVHACARAGGRGGGGGPGVRSYMYVCVLLVGAPTSSSSLPPCTRPRRQRGPSRTARA